MYAETKISQKSNQVKKSIPLGWNIFDINFTTGGLFGYSSVNSIVSLKVPVMKMINIIIHNKVDCLIIIQSKTNQIRKVKPGQTRNYNLKFLAD